MLQIRPIQVFFVEVHGRGEALPECWVADTSHCVVFAFLASFVPVVRASVDVLSSLLARTDSSIISPSLLRWQARQTCVSVPKFQKKAEEGMRPSCSRPSSRITE